MKYLIIGLGNIGDEYANTRHNIGFDIADALVEKYKETFRTDRYADVAEISLRGRQLIVIKPNTYMNLSGKAVRHWMQQLKLKPENIFVLVDDLAIPFQKIRIRGNGSDAGHNGLKSIQELILTQNYPRLRFGIGSNFPKGRQVDFVLGKWGNEELIELPSLIQKSVQAIETFALRGLAASMNEFNK
ncbi:MAG: aminoacyl-tRNA hydrolase [Bacteroidia bacterium]|nr:aminoacyl-tRNA hydrolase [Bacteroidia bacterium]MCF8425691.1 aminoacyl-tRNA hydrolase [Bacteroidia bacterium]MCF8446015.1 aminoacyl-tRNA hydrolase [Bacteroidia bacterium]